MKKLCLTILALLILASCASQRPVLYPNDQLKRVGNSAADRDIDTCRQLADQYVSENRVGKSVEGAVTESGTSAAIGAAAGGAGGAIVGRAGTSAAIGAAGGGAAGATRGLFYAFSSKHDPAPVYKNFVNRCLRERGYQPIGWN